MNKPSIPKGTRDFGPVVMSRRNWILRAIRSGFERHGMAPIETPAMENLATLTGKYGEEGDQLIFRILNNGDYLSKADESAWNDRNSKALTPSIAKKALRYDLTVPFARFVVMARNELSFPFRRYQIQTVWRGDRPGRGRYQEFTQCDADIIGTESLVSEFDLIQLFTEVLTELKIPQFEVLLNDRRILSGFAETWGVQDRLTDLTIAMDKLDKVGAEGVDRELTERGFSDEVRAGVQAVLKIQELPTHHDRLQAVESLLESSSEGIEGVRDIRTLLSWCTDIPADRHVVFDPTLARGLSYYTGAIFEVRVPGAPVGSICGGGRYADLTGIFGWPGNSGVGISFGADRIYDVCEHFGLFPEGQDASTDVLVLRMDESGTRYDLRMVDALRAAGWRTTLYPDLAKMKKQLKYAADLQVKYVVFVGEEERVQGLVTLKNMAAHNEERVAFGEVESVLKAWESA
jgi:histidyl-tRNA synthetase